MNVSLKTCVVESADFMLNKHEFRGEPITALHEIKGKIYLFTPNHTYVIRKMRWHEQVWRSLIKRLKGC